MCVPLCFGILLRIFESRQGRVPFPSAINFVVALLIDQFLKFTFAQMSGRKYYGVSRKRFTSNEALLRCIALHKYCIEPVPPTFVTENQEKYFSVGLRKGSAVVRVVDTAPAPADGSRVVTGKRLKCSIRFAHCL